MRRKEGPRHPHLRQPAWKFQARFVIIICKRGFIHFWRNIKKFLIFSYHPHHLYLLSPPFFFFPSSLLPVFCLYVSLCKEVGRNGFLEGNSQVIYFSKNFFGNHLTIKNFSLLIEISPGSQKSGWRFLGEGPRVLDEVSQLGGLGDGGWPTSCSGGGGNKNTIKPII